MKQTGPHVSLKLRAHSLVLASIALVATVSNLHAQSLQPGQWVTYTSMRAISDIALAADSNSVWAVTNGGAFRIPLDGNYAATKTLRNSDGLSENALTAVATDQDGNVYLGGFSGSFAIYTESNGRIQRKTDIINQTDLARKNINSIAVYGPRVYLSAGYGVSVFDRSTGQFGVTITRFSHLRDQDTAVAVIESNGNTFVALVDSIAVAPTSGLSGEWRSIRGIHSGVHGIAEFQGNVFVGTDSGLYRYVASADTFALVVTGQIGKVIAPHTRDSLYYIARDGLSIFASADGQHFSGRSIPGSSSNNPCIAALFAINSTAVYASAAAGLTIETPRGVTSSIAPPGPIGNIANDVSFSQGERKLYVSNAYTGISVFDATANRWTIFHSGDVVPGGTGFRSVFWDSVRSVVWLGTQGSGLVKGQNLTGTPSFVRIHQPTIPFSASPDYIITSHGGLDHTGRFLTTVWAANGKGLLRTSDGATFEQIQLGDYESYGDVTEDLDGNLWVGTESNGLPADYGVYYVRTNGTVGGIPGTSGGVLPRPDVNAVIVDQDDALWCGTNTGVRILSNISQVTGGGTGPFDGRDVPILQQQTVHCIVVDGVNNKWIGTERGVFVVSPDGSDSLAHFTTDNSPLVDNSVQGIAIDAKNGEAYLATLNGISRLSTIFKEGRTDYSQMHVYPNPVVQSSDEAPTVVVTGLVGASTVKIFTISGRLVATIDGTQLGSTVTWNGRDETGRQLASGVYIVSATSTQTSDYGQSKFVLIRRP